MVTTGASRRQTQEETHHQICTPVKVTRSVKMMMNGGGGGGGSDAGTSVAEARWQ